MGKLPSVEYLLSLKEVMSTKEIAKKYGVSYAAVWHKLRHTYRQRPHFPPFIPRNVVLYWYYKMGMTQSEINDKAARYAADIQKERNLP